jgi:hypothetical protein
VGAHRPIPALRRAIVESVAESSVYSSIDGASACTVVSAEPNSLDRFDRSIDLLICTPKGYDYCSSCTDYRALVPRRGPAQGYDAAHVCAFCIEMLNGMCSPVYHTPKLIQLCLCTSLDSCFHDVVVIPSHCPWPSSATIAPPRKA